MSETKTRYITCFHCKRTFELNESEDGSRLWGKCPVCQTEYEIKIKKK